MRKICWENSVVYYFHQYSNTEKQIINNKDIWKGLSHFRIARNFKDIKNSQIKNEFLSIINDVIHQNISYDQRYSILLKKFQLKFNKLLLSATSKILWLMDSKDSYVILDTLALNTLSELAGNINSEGEEKYFEFKSKWFHIFYEELPNIDRAIERTKDYFANSQNFNRTEDLEKLDEMWFKMRVFDMFLWNPN